MTMRFIEIGSNKAEMKIESIGLYLLLCHAMQSQLNEFSQTVALCVCSNKYIYICLRFILPVSTIATLECGLRKLLAPKIIIFLQK